MSAGLIELAMSDAKASASNFPSCCSMAAAAASNDFDDLKLTCVTDVDVVRGAGATSSEPETGTTANPRAISVTRPEKRINKPRISMPPWRMLLSLRITLEISLSQVARNQWNG